MPWFKVDDALHAHMKVAEAAEAMALWVVAGSWCAQQLTDGFIPDAIADRLMPDAKTMAARLVDVGLWDEADKDGRTGWQFHDWHDFQPVRADVLAKREAARERMANARNRSRDVRANRTRSVLNPDPTRPDPTETNKQDGPSDVDRQFTDQFWPAYLDVARGRPTGAGSKAKAHRTFRRLSTKDRDRAVKALDTYHRLLLARDTNRDTPWPSMHATTFLNGRFFDDVERELESANASVTPSDVVQGTCGGCGQFLATHNDTLCDR